MVNHFKTKRANYGLKSESLEFDMVSTDMLMYGHQYELVKDNVLTIDKIDKKVSIISLHLLTQGC